MTDMQGLEVWNNAKLLTKLFENAVPELSTNHRYFVCVRGRARDKQAGLTDDSIAF